MLHELRDAPTAEGVGLAAERVYEHLARHVGRWVGLDGYDVLLTRALDEARAEHPWLADVRTHPRATPHFEKLDTSLREQNPDDAAEALAGILTAFINLLGGVVGHPLARRLVLDAWPTDEDFTRRHRGW